MTSLNWWPYLFRGKHAAALRFPWYMNLKPTQTMYYLYDGGTDGSPLGQWVFFKGIYQLPIITGPTLLRDDPPNKWKGKSLKFTIIILASSLTPPPKWVAVASNDPWWTDGGMWIPSVMVTYLKREVGSGYHFTHGMLSRVNWGDSWKAILHPLRHPKFRVSFLDRPCVQLTRGNWGSWDTTSLTIP